MRLNFFGAGGGTRYDATASTRPRQRKQFTELFSSAALLPVRVPQLKKNSSLKKGNCLFGAGGGTRTRTMSPPTDFESVTSANSITPAYKIYNNGIIQ